MNWACRVDDVQDSLQKPTEIMIFDINEFKLTGSAAFVTNQLHGS